MMLKPSNPLEQSDLGGFSYISKKTGEPAIAYPKPTWPRLEGEKLEREKKKTIIIRALFDNHSSVPYMAYKDLCDLMGHEATPEEFGNEKWNPKEKCWTGKDGSRTSLPLWVIDLSESSSKLYPDQFEEIMDMPITDLYPTE